MARPFPAAVFSTTLHSVSAPLKKLWILFAAIAMIAACTTVAGAHPADVTDVDHDGYKNWADNCPKNYNPKQTDTDGDTPEPVYESGQSTPQTGPITVRPHTPVDPGQETPADQSPEVGGDSCDIDDDNDGIYDKRGPGRPGPDNCRMVANPDQEDADSDGKGDVCDEDDDNDTILDTADNCPMTANLDQRDTNKDGKGDVCDPTAPRRASGSLLGGADPNDKRAPKLTISKLKLLRYAELNKGIAVRVTCSEGCILDGALTLGGTVARRLKVTTSRTARQVVVGRGAAQVAEKGMTYVFVKLSKKTLARLKRTRKVKTVLRVTARDASGNKAAKRTSIQLKR